MGSVQTLPNGSSQFLPNQFLHEQGDEHAVEEPLV